MELILSKRMMNTASMVGQGATVADIGCDHGYLGIWLLLQGIATRVFASDLRPMPLASAKRNAERWGVADRMEFLCASGLRGLAPGQADTIVCGGMGGDLMTGFLSETPWVFDPRYTLLLQPQAGVPKMRRWLLENGFSICREAPCCEEHFAYSTMLVRYTGQTAVLSPGQTYVSPALLESESADLPGYIEHMLQSVRKTVSGLRCASAPGQRLAYYETALREIEEMRDQICRR